MKQLRKDDGYILVYVLVVFLVLSFAAVAICTGAVQNLRAQQASIARTQALYEAEGQIEHFVALLDEMKADTPVSSDSNADAKDNAQEAFWHDLRILADSLEHISVDIDHSTLDSLLVQSVSADGTAKIDAELRVHLKLDVERNPADTSQPVISYTCAYAMSQDAVYRSYDISYSTGGDAG